LLPSTTNRHSRAIDRARELIKDLEETADHVRRKSLLEQVRLTYRRGRILQVSIILSSVSILFVAVTVLTVLALFTGQVMGVAADYVSVPCFGVFLLALVGSLYFFIQDVSISLKALELEIAPYSAE
jgi:ABC-type multidrug transport system permease subunit